MTNQLSSLGMKVSGNIVMELSDRIPDSYIAMNELIKNAYDADAKEIIIEVCSEKKIITITDDGNGMDREAIESLLHIARSNKNYACVRKNGRMIQGEKGLGALATFHFGDIVTWETSTDGTSAYNFTLEKNIIINSDNINKYQTEFAVVSSNFKGTKITIESLDRNEFNYLVSSLKDKKISSKLVRSLYDSKLTDTLTVSLIIDNINIINEKNLIIDKKNNRMKTYNVRYDSDEEMIYYFFRGKLFLKEPFVMDTLLGDFGIKCNLNIYDFSDNIVRSRHFPELYKKEIEKDEITPLVYINQNFFKNYTLFDADLMRDVRHYESLPQMTGEIEIKSKNPNLKFNADRTEINDNFVTSKLKTEISRLNQTIQRIGAKYKHPLIAINKEECPFFNEKRKDIYILKKKELDVVGLNEVEINKAIKDNILENAPKSSINYEVFNDKVIYTFLQKTKKVRLRRVKEDNLPSKKDDKEKNNTSKPAIITLKNKTTTKNINSGQIDLFDYIVKEKTVDSTGKEIPFNSINIKNDRDSMGPINIIPSISSPQFIKVTYSYNDRITGRVSESLLINFVEPPTFPMSGDSRECPLIHTHGIIDFQITFDPVVVKLAKQINKLANGDFLEVISCSLRVLFELGVDAIRSTRSTDERLVNLQKRIPNNKSLHNNVELITKFVKQKDVRQEVTEYITKEYSSVSFRTFGNLANAQDIKSSVESSNLGSHKASRHLTEEKTKNIASDASSFLIFVEGIIGVFSNRN